MAVALYIESTTACLWVVSEELRLCEFRFKRQRVHAHLLNHGQQTVAARGGEVFRQTDFADEIKVGVENFLWRMAAHHADE